MRVKQENVPMGGGGVQQHDTIIFLMCVKEIAFFKVDLKKY